MDGFPLLEQMNSRQCEHYLSWAKGFHTSVQGKIGYLDGALLHLWHGSRAARGYNERYRHLKPFDFDPYRDIAMSENGLWKWHTDNTGMHDYVRDYFASRSEDGG